MINKHLQEVLARSIASDIDRNPAGWGRSPTPAMWSEWEGPSVSVRISGVDDNVSVWTGSESIALNGRAGRTVREALRRLERSIKEAKVKVLIARLVGEQAK
jgi:hypothetical protein